MNIGNYLSRYSEDLKLKNYSENTINNYIKQVEIFLKYFDNMKGVLKFVEENKLNEYPYISI